MTAIPNRMLRSLNVSGWRQFHNVSIDFHPRLTLITGANGAGKTTLLNLLAPHFGWQIPLATVPSPIDRVVQYLTSAWHTLLRVQRATGPEQFAVIARIVYDDGTQTEVLIPEHTSEHTYIISYDSNATMPGLYIPSHRSVFVPTVVKTPRSPVIPSEAFSRYSGAVRSAWVPNTKSAGTPLQHLKETLLGWAGQTSPPFPEYFEGFAASLRDVLPGSLGFVRLFARKDEIVLETTTGEFTLDAVSGGMAALIDLTWQIYLYSKTVDGPFVVLIDEPENHLHPELQRSVLYKLTEAFPLAQFIATSHAPLVVTSVQDAHVYALQFADAPPDESSGGGVSAPSGSGSSADENQPQRIVVVRPLHGLDRSATANEILRNVLGLEYTMPVWAANILETAVAEAAAAGYTKEALKRLDARLHENKLDQYGTEALTALNERYRSRAPEANA